MFYDSQLRTHKSHQKQHENYLLGHSCITLEAPNHVLLTFRYPKWILGPSSFTSCHILPPLLYPPIILQSFLLDLTSAMGECAAFVSACLPVPEDPGSHVPPLVSRPSKAGAGELFGGRCQCKSPTTMRKRRKLAIEPPNLSEENFAAFQSFWCIKFSLLPGRNFNAIVSLKVFCVSFFALFCSQYNTRVDLKNVQCEKTPTTSSSQSHSIIATFIHFKLHFEGAC